MRIKSVYAANFKSLIDFGLELPKFSCLIGLNGAGKSTILHFIDFIGQQVRGNFKEWLDERSWRARDLTSRFTTKKNIEFSISLVNSNGEGGVRWDATFNTSEMSCTTEHIVTPGATLDVERGELRIIDLTEKNPERQLVLKEQIAFSYQGSILSQLKEERLPESLLGFRNYFTTITSLDLLSPELLRQRTREASGSLGLGGQRLSAFVYELEAPERQRLTQELQKAYRQVLSMNPTSLRSGWKQLNIVERFGDKLLKTEARHVNDGMLRLIAILAELETHNRFLLFDEIENGVNPELIEFIIDKLVTAKQQILVTTHSPMILNYVDDAVAKDGVIYVYKTPEGDTRSIPFFSIPSLAKKLEVMGPGEAFVDTNLTDLFQEIAQQQRS